MIKFELEPDIKNITDDQLIADLIQVASQLKSNSLTQKEYKKYGKFGDSIFWHRFGSWSKALAKAGLNKSRKKITIKNEELIEDILRVAAELKTDSITRKKYDSHGKFNSDTFRMRFGSWIKTKETAGLSSKRRENPSTSDEDYFKNLEEVWIKLGRQPHFSDMKIPFSKYSGSGYYANFGGWRKALECFIEYINKEETSVVPTEPSITAISESPRKVINESMAKSEQVNTTIEKLTRIEKTKSAQKPIIEHKTKRAVSDRLRYRVMRRDEFRCQRCGRTWSSDNILEIDHISAWSKGGETTFENLRTLCSSCNRGKGNLE
ncbi:MAG: HNH endonuclease [Candidatus Brocadiaceae bacterium]|nr:HNH endonuclease [Candidatus Brocadiaceae bacterium]